MHRLKKVSILKKIFSFCQKLVISFQFQIDFIIVAAQIVTVTVHDKVYSESISLENDTYSPLPLYIFHFRQKTLLWDQINQFLVSVEPKEKFLLFYWKKPSELLVKHEKVPLRFYLAKGVSITSNVLTHLASKIWKMRMREHLQLHFIEHWNYWTD